MAKNSTPPAAAGRSKVRLVFVEADLAPGEIRELTDALTTAMRPAPHIVTRAPARLVASDEVSSPGNGEIEDVEFVADVEDESGDAETVETPAQRGSPKPRKYRSPKVDASINTTAFKEFAKEKGNPEEHTTRFLLAAFWLTETLNIPAVSVDQVYTCYKSAGWTLNVTDPGFAFRALKKDGAGDTKAGKFTINHIGRARVEELKAGEV